MEAIGSPARFYFVLGCISAAIAVAAGAFGAHGLKGILSPEMLTTYETAVRYQMYHAFGLIATALASGSLPNSKTKLVGWCFAGGTVLFSGSLYLLTLTGILWLGAITPLGGIAFIAGWVTLGYSIYQNHPQ